MLIPPSPTHPPHLTLSLAQGGGTKNFVRLNAIENQLADATTNLTAAARRAAVIIMSRYLFVYVCIYLSVYVVTPIRPLIGPMWECFIVNEVIVVDELDEGKIFAAAGKQDK